MSVPTTTGTHPNCQSIAESLRPISSVTLTVSYSGAFSISGPTYNGTLDISGSNTRTWTRVRLGAINPGDPPDAGYNRPAPGENKFNLFDYGCACCKCRVGWVFDDALPPTSPDLDSGGGASLIVDVTMEETTDPPPEDPTTHEDLLTDAEFWSSQAAPCKVIGGPRLHGAPDLTLGAYTQFPDVPFPYGYDYFDDPSLPTTTVDGNHGATSEGGPFGLSGVVVFSDVNPCIDADSYTFVSTTTNSFTDGDGNANEYTLGIEYTLEFS